jgi:hypothetical protein
MTLKSRRRALGILVLLLALVLAGTWRAIENARAQQRMLASARQLVQTLYSARELRIGVRYIPSKSLEHVWPMLAPQMTPRNGYIQLDAHSLTILDADRREVVTLSKDGGGASLMGASLSIHDPAVDWARSLLVPGVHPFLPTILGDPHADATCSKQDNGLVLTLSEPGGGHEEWTIHEGRVTRVKYVSGRSDRGEIIYADVLISATFR